MAHCSRPGVLVLPPDAADPKWRVFEVDSDVLDSVHVPPDAPVRDDESSGYVSALAALDAAYDTLTLIAEGRAPAMHEHVQESVREFVQVLEDRGYDREAALRLLLEMVDRLSDRSPVRPDRTAREAKRAS